MEVAVETLAGEDDIEGVGPPEVEMEQTLDKLDVRGYACPRAVLVFVSLRAQVRAGQRVVLILGHQAQGRRVSIVTRLARLRNRRLAQQHREVALERLVRGGVQGERDRLLPRLGEAANVQVGVLADVLHQLEGVRLGQAADRLEQEVGVVVGVGRGGLVALHGGRGLGAAALAGLVVVAFGLVDGGARRAHGSAAIALYEGHLSAARARRIE